MQTATMASAEVQVLEDVSWEAYEALLRSWQHRRLRLTYDHGRLEIMSPLLAHERYGSLIAQMVETFTVERGIERHTGGSTTFKREVKQRGLEPDECYWIQSEERMRSRTDFDPEVDPPPDLAIEIDITSSSLDRMSIYADLGVPEVWRFKGQTLSIHVLSESGEYETSEVSVALPELTPEVVMRFLQHSHEVSETTLIREFIAWVRGESKGRGRKGRRAPKK